MSERRVVVGLGGAFAGDDAVGLHVARELAAEGMTALEMSDPSLLLPLFERGDKLIVVDAWGQPARRGEVVKLDPSALAATACRTSSHGLSLSDVLAIGQALYGSARARFELVAVAIDPAACHPGELSAPARAAVRAALPLIRELARATNQG